MLSRQEAEKSGIARRDHLGRSSLAKLSSRKFDPLDVLRDACRGHVHKLVAVKFDRMRQTPFAFFRGAVEIMAADLGATKNTAIEVQICGDAHLKNFGFFATQGSDIVLDLNDFDQTQRGPWEWDVKRMATSIMLAGRVAGDGEAPCKVATELFLREYVRWIRRFAAMPTLEVARHRAIRSLRNPLIRSALRQAERSTPGSNLQKLARPTKGGSYRFIEKPHLTWRIAGQEKQAVLHSLNDYRQTLSCEHSMILDRYTPEAVAFKVVGTGSVGTRVYAVLLLGRDEKDPLFLQIKEELPSAYSPYYKDRSLPRHQGERVVFGQRRMQIFSDLLLGWCSIEGRDYLVRQLSDHKSSVDPEALKAHRLSEYSRVCAELLAKGHARSGDPAILASYIGRSSRAVRALVQFATKYADQTEKDFQLFNKALRHGFLKTATETA
jgi:uncharacterized protein (DUF2252 family)